ncbi:MAG TPA: substrate-binding domain-containing protein, partial [Chloroflexota bacterium]
PQVHGIIAKLAELDDVLAAIQTGNAGPLRIVATRSAGQNVLPGILDEFQEVFPRAAVQLDVVPAQRILDVLRKGTYDVAIGPLVAAPDDLLADRLYEDEPVLFVTPDSALARKPTLTSEDVRDETFIGPFTLPFWSTLWEELVSSQPPGSRKMPVVDTQRVKQLVETGTGIGLLFKTSIRQELEQGTFVRLPIHGLSLPHELYFLRRKGVELLPLAEQFRNFVIGRTRSH